MTKVIVASAPFPEQRRTFEVSAEHLSTIAQIVAMALPHLADTSGVRVTISHGDRVWPVPREAWDRVRPRAGTWVIIRPVAGGPVLPLLQVIASHATAAFINATGIYSLGAAQAFYAGVVGSGLLASAAVVGAIASSLVPSLPKRKEQPAGEELYSLEGWSNRIAPDAAFPFPVGRIRMSPVFIALPFSDIINEEQYLYGYFCWGHGELQIEDIRIGNTPIGDLPGVEVETVPGTDADPEITLISEQVIQDRLGLELLPPNAEGEIFHHWTTPRETDVVRLIFQWPGGLYRQGKDGGFRPAGVGIKVWLRENGGTDWVEIDRVEQGRSSNDGFFHKKEWVMPHRGIWDVRIARDTGASSNTITTTFLVAASGIRRQRPLNIDFPLARSAIRVKASALANGTLDAVNGIVTRYCDTWDGTSWSRGLPRNPASVVREILTHPHANFAPVAASQIHMDELQDWWEFCDTRGLKYDRVLAGDENLATILMSVCAAGRGWWRRDGLGWGVGWDEVKDAPVALIDATNSFGLRWSKRYRRLPDAFIATFLDETSGYEKSERVVLRPGFTGEPRVLEEVSLEGRTDPAQVYQELRWRGYEAEHRPDVFTVFQSGPQRESMRGDMVGLSCEMLDLAQMSARVVRSVDAVVVLDAFATMEEGERYGIRWHVADEENPEGVFVEATVATDPGETRILRIDNGVEPPAPGTRLNFGRVELINWMCKVTSVEAASEGSYRLSLQLAAPEIDALSLADVPPAWNRITGTELPFAGTPDAPVIGTVTAAHPTFAYTDDGNLEVSIPVGMPTTNRVSVGRIDVSHRVVGAPSFDVTSVTGEAGIAALLYPAGISIEYFATAYSIFGDVSADTATGTFAVTGGMPLPTPIDPDGLTAMGGLGYAQLSFATQADTAQVQVFRVPEGDTLDVETHAIGAPMPVVANSSLSYTDGDATRTNIVTAGDMSDAGAWTLGGGWAIAGGLATHTPGAASTMSQALTVADDSTYRGYLIVSGRTAGTVSVQLAGASTVASAAFDDNGQFYFALPAVSGLDRIEIVASTDFDGAVETILAFRATSTSAPQGAFSYYVAPLNGDDIATAPTGPVLSTIV